MQNIKLNPGSNFYYINIEIRHFEKLIIYLDFMNLTLLSI